MPVGVKTSHSEIMEMLGLSVSAPKELSVIEVDVYEKMVRLLVAIGQPREEIAKRLDLEPDFVDQCVSSPRGCEEVIRFQTAMCPDPAQRVKKLANLALDVKTRLMLTSKNDAVVNAASSDILDRTIGKAAIKTENVNISMDGADAATVDRALAAQQEKLAQLDLIESRISKASPVDLIELIKASNDNRGD